MKSSANPSHRQHHPQQQQRPSNAGQQPHNQPGRPSLVSGELLAANMSNDASNADPAALLERSTLLETKRAIDRLKSVTGMTKILRYYAISSYSIRPLMMGKEKKRGAAAGCVFFIHPRLFLFK